MLSGWMGRYVGSVCYGGGILVKVVVEEGKKVLAEVDVQDLPKFSVFTSNGLTVVLWRSAVAC